MIYERKIFGGNEYLYPTDINNWSFDESLLDGFNIPINTSSLIDESRYSALIENIQDNDDICLINELMENCNNDTAHDSLLTHEYLYECFYKINGFTGKKSNSYRSCNVTIGGIRPPYYFDVLPLMDNFISFCNDSSIPLVKRVILGHLYFEMVHPFMDGNGRIGRLIMYKMSKGCFSWFFYDNRMDYYRLLNANLSGSLNDWVKFVRKIEEY